MKRIATMGSLIFFFLLSPCLASQPLKVFTVENPAGFAASLSRFEKEKLRFQLAEGEDKWIAAKDIIEIRYGKQEGSKAAGKGPVILEFTNGDKLKGRISKGGEESIQFSSLFMKELSIEIESLQRILFHENARKFPFILSWEPIQNQDTIYRVTEKGWDHVKGILTSLGSDRISINTDLGDFTFRTSQLIAIGIFQPPPGKKPEGILAILRLSDGSSLTGRITKISPQTITFEWLKGRVLRIPTKQVLSLGFKNTRYTFLSDLEPVQVVQTPFIGEEKDFLFPYQKDATCTGNPLSLGGNLYFKGLGVHSRSRLTYALDGKFSSFSSIIGMDDEIRTIPAKGSAVFRVLVDGELKFESPLIQGGSSSTAVSLKELGQARRLTLEVDFGDEGDSGDRADWVHALVVSK